MSKQRHFRCCSAFEMLYGNCSRSAKEVSSQAAWLLRAAVSPIGNGDGHGTVSEQELPGDFDRD